ncbi:ASCH domain-containing protein [Flexithrix dorotheae]|uniref:ASCH domain-containing protein n=1 Tax=Flexithrix dorotheae TaxID=70993 RepID=UPI00036EA35D|nr:ASCH domain-containing protein [Flexithrix dorotheae]
MSDQAPSSVVKIWEEFLKDFPNLQNKHLPEYWYFCDNQKDADECAYLVVKGIKRATSTSLWWFQKNKAQLPVPGDLAIITDWNKNAKAIIETISVQQIPYHKITAEHAAIEGEGDKSLAYWKKVHWAYYSREMAPFSESPSDDMIIIFEQFKCIFPATN